MSSRRTQHNGRKSNKSMSFSAKVRTDVQIGGLSKILDPGRSWTERLAWMTIVFGSTCLLGFLLYERLEYYLKMPVLADVQSVEYDQLRMPAITICINYPKEGKLYTNDTSETDLYKLLLKKRRLKPLNITDRLTELKKYKNFDWKQLLTNLWPPKFYKSCLFVKSAIGLQTLKCNSTKFKITDNSDLFLIRLRMPCLTIHDPNWTVSSDGFLLLVVDQKPAGYDATYFMTVHDPKESPKVRDDGIKLYSRADSPRKFLIHLKRTDMHLVPFRCTRGKMLKYFPVYSEARCVTECFLNYSLTLAPCNCVIPIGFPSSNFPNVSICLPSEWKYCFHRAWVGFSANRDYKQSCNCEPLCEQEIYEYEKEVTTLRGTKKTMNSTTGTYFKIFVKYKGTKVKRIQQKAVGTFYRLLAELGGLFSLLIGARLITIFEIFSTFGKGCFESSGRLCRKLLSAGELPEKNDHFDNQKIYNNRDLPANIRTSLLSKSQSQNSTQSGVFQNGSVCTGNYTKLSAEFYNNDPVSSRRAESIPPSDSRYSNAIDRRSLYNNNDPMTKGLPLYYYRRQSRAPSINSLPRKGLSFSETHQTLV